MWCSVAGGAQLFFPKGTSASDFEVQGGTVATLTVVRVGSKYFIEKVSHGQPVDNSLL